MPDIKRTNAHPEKFNLSISALKKLRTELQGVQATLEELSSYTGSENHTDELAALGFNHESVTEDTRAVTRAISAIDALVEIPAMPKGTDGEGVKIPLENFTFFDLVALYASGAELAKGQEANAMALLCEELDNTAAALKLLAWMLKHFDKVPVYDRTMETKEFHELLAHALLIQANVIKCCADGGGEPLLGTPSKWNGG